jgi:hypothetical protein
MVVAPPFFATTQASDRDGRHHGGGTRFYENEGAYRTGRPFRSRYLM